MQTKARERIETNSDKGLLLIGIFKIVKAIFFVGLGFGALHFIHHDLTDTLQHWVDRHQDLIDSFERVIQSRGFDSENHFVSLLLDKAELITHHRLRQMAFGTFAYAALATVEGVGLMRRKVWAEYLTLWLSISFLPWELFEIVKHPNWWRFAVLATNLVIVAYLVWFIQRKKKQDSEQ